MNILIFWILILKVFPIILAHIRHTYRHTSTPIARKKIYVSEWKLHTEKVLNSPRGQRGGMTMSKHGCSKMSMIEWAKAFAPWLRIMKNGIWSWLEILSSNVYTHTNTHTHTKWALWPYIWTIRLCVNVCFEELLRWMNRIFFTPSHFSLLCRWVERERGNLGFFHFAWVRLTQFYSNPSAPFFDCLIESLPVGFIPLS